ncbi:MAG: trypsin-like peptidase domain-containing protein [Clostridia bacterium]|nr:trypsin-like peptidase domain-containing protein [Clostridia bacterium]
MSYYDGLEERNTKKIPYDDTPISRNSSGSRRQVGGSSPKTVKVLATLVAVLIFVNIALVIMTFYYLKNSVVKNVYYNTYNLPDSSDVSTYSVSNAKWSSVSIAAGTTISTEEEFYGGGYSSGSGVILKKTNSEVYILTCYHVVDSYQDRVYLMAPSSLKPVKATFVGHSKRYDIAVVKTTEIDEFDGCTAVEVFDSTYLEEGEGVFAVGNSLGAGMSITSGLVSKLNSLVVTETTNTKSLRVIQTSADINPGNSGGGLFNTKGQLVGIVNAKKHTTKNGGSTVTVLGTAFAIPSNMAVSIGNSIIENNGTPRCANLGLVFSHNASHGVEQFVDDTTGKTISKYTVCVDYINSASPASGKLQVGDMIVSFTYTDKSNVRHTCTMFNKYSYDDVAFNVKPGSNITFNIKRGLLGNIDNGATDKEITFNVGTAVYSTLDVDERPAS